MKAKTVMYTLVQDTAQLMISFQNYKIFHSCFFRLDPRSQSCRTSAYNNQIISILHFSVPSRTFLPYLYKVSSFESPPAFVRVRGETFSSLARISMVLGEQNPAWHLPMPARVLRFTPSRDLAPNGLRIALRISPSVTVSQRQITFP